MRLDAVKAALALGTVKNIIKRGNMETYPAPPYVLIYDDYPLNSYYTVGSTVNPFIVEVHYPAGYRDAVDKYIEEECLALLHRKVLNDDGVSFQVFATPNVTPLVEPNDDMTLSAGNDDGTLSRRRRFFTPTHGL